MDSLGTLNPTEGRDGRQELLRKISSVIEQELRNLAAVQRPTLRIEAIVDEGANDIGQNFNFRRMSLVC